MSDPNLRELVARINDRLRVDGEQLAVLEPDHPRYSRQGRFSIVDEADHVIEAWVDIDQLAREVLE